MNQKPPREAPVGTPNPYQSDDSFLRAILAAPEDDAPRLAYADWLEQHGQAEWAEFIRIECEQAAIHDKPEVAPNEWDNPRYWELERRRSKLYDRSARHWFPLAFQVFRGDMTTHRGFPWFVALSARRFIKQGEAIFRAAPTIEEVMITGLGRNMPDLARCPALGRVRRLQFFETPFRGPEAEQLAGSPHLGNLRGLHIGFTDTRIGPRGAIALAYAGSLRQLQHLDVHSHAVYDQGAEALLRSERLATLTSINLGNNGLTDETAMASNEAGHLKLTSLDLGSNHLSGRGVGALADAAHLAGLERLNLGGNPIGHRGAIHLGGARFADRLRSLWVRKCQMDDQAAAVVLGAGFPELRELSLSFNEVGEQAARALAVNRSLVRLESLSLASCGIGLAVAGRLGQVPLPGLRDLDAGNNPLGPEGVRALLAGPLSGPVTHLDLRAAGLGDAGAEALAASPAIANVRWLELPDNQITDRGAAALAESPHLAAVRSLNLSGNGIGPAAREALTRRFGERVRV